MTARLRQILICCLFGVLFSQQAFGQATLVPNAKQQFIDANGKPYANGTVGMYVPNTFTFKSTWNVPTQATQNQNPVLLDSAGRAIIYGLGNYRQILKDKNGNQVWDNLTAAPPTAATSAASGSGDFLAVGTVLAIAGFTAPVNYVLAYGQPISRVTYPDALAALTISSAATCINGTSTISGITDTSQIRVSAPIEASCLPPGTTVASIVTSTSITTNVNANVSGATTIKVFEWGNGDGSSTFNVPDLRGRTFAGADAMGGTPAGRLTATYYGPSAATPASPSATGPSQLLATQNLPPYTPAGTINTPTITIGGATTGGTSTYSGPGGGGAGTGINAVGTITASSSALTFTGSAQGGTSVPFSIVQPTMTVNYVIKIANGTLPVVGVLSLGGMTGDILCGAGLTCSGQVIAATPLGAIPLPQNNVFVGNLLGQAIGVPMSGDCTIIAAGAITCTKTNGVNFAASATTDTTNASNITSGVLGSTHGGAGTNNGLLKGNGSGATSVATITGTANQIAVTNGNGAAGNPTISLPSTMDFTGITATGGTWNSGVIDATSLAIGGVPVGTSTDTFWSLVGGGPNIQYSAGNTGVGAAPPAWGASIKAFNVGNFGFADDSAVNANEFGIYINNYFDGSVLKYVANGYAYGITFGLPGTSAGSISFYGAPSGTAGGTVTSVTTLNLSRLGALTLPAYSTNDLSTTANGVAAFTSAGLILSKPSYTTSIFYASDYGMKCDDSTDDQTAFQSALTAGAGARVELPAGKCILGSAVTLSKGTIVNGAGQGVTCCGAAATDTGTILKANFASGDVIVATGLEGFVFSNFQVASAVGARTGGAGIHISGVIDQNQTATFTGVISGTTLTISGITGNVVKGSVIKGSGVTANTAIAAFLSGTGGNGTYTVNNSQSIGSEAMTGFQPANNQNSRIENITFDQQLIGVHMTLPGDPHIINTHHYRLSAFGGAARGILCDNANAGTLIDHESSCGHIEYNEVYDFNNVSFASLEIHMGYTDVLYNSFIGGQIAILGNYDTTASGTTRITGNLVENQTAKGFYFVNGNGITASLFQITTNEFSTSNSTMTSEIEIVAGSGNWCDNVQVFGNTIRSQISSGSGAMISWNACSNVQITGNTINYSPLGGSSNIVGIGTGGNITVPALVADNTFVGTSSASNYSINSVTTLRDMIGMTAAQLPGAAAPGSQVYVTDGKPNNLGLFDYNVVGGSYGTLAVKVNAGAAWVAGGIHN